MGREGRLSGAALLGVAVLLICFFGGERVSATHFRFGTISWCYNAENNPTREVTFQVNLAYRRNYDWGNYYGEQWGRYENGKTGIQWSTQSVNGIVNPDPTNPFMQFPSGIDYVSPTTPYFLMFPTGYGRNAVPLDKTRNQLQCKDPVLYAGNTTGFNVLPCVPWSEAVGWFYGDGTYDTLELRLNEVDFSDTKMGNYIRGDSFFTHNYPSPTAPGGSPWIAYFTGGNRLSELNNNHDGRYRLETQIVLIPGVSNCSPRATGLPVLPVPYVGRAHTSEYGLMSTFQIAAYDPDIRQNKYGTDQLTFRLGTVTEYGYIWQHRAEGVKGAPIQWSESDWNDAVAALLVANPTRKTFGIDNQPAKWNPAFDFQHSPADLVIDQYTGVVTWETGINFFTNDTDAYISGPKAGTVPNPLLPPKKPGFYNLVVMVMSDAHNPANVNQLVSVPLDFLMYLYPPLKYCSMGCKKGAPTAIVTFRDKDGLYGDAGLTEPQNTWNLKGTDTGLPAAGTGMCTICGGGETIPTFAVNDGFCVPPIDLTGIECTGDCPGVRVDALNKPVTMTTACTKVQPPNANKAVRIVPADGACKDNRYPRFLPRTPQHMDWTPPVNQSDFMPIKRAYITYLEGEEVMFNLVARDDDDCVELSIRMVGLYSDSNVYMFLDPSTRDGPSQIAPGEGPGHQIRAKFHYGVWNTKMDTRPPELTVCFYAFDNYLLSMFYCARLTKTFPPPPPPPPPLIWCDERVDGFGRDIYALSGATYGAYLDEEICIPLCIRNGQFVKTTFLDILTVNAPGNSSLPAAPFPFPYDVTNTPVNGYFNFTPNYANPLFGSYCFRPNKYEECVYTICFQGFDFDVKYPDQTTVRCFKVEVRNDVLEFLPGEPAAVVAEDVGVRFNKAKGLTFSAWVFPYCDVQGLNETVLLFNGSDNDPKGGVAWRYANGAGSFGYFDQRTKGVWSPVQYACDKWHYVAVSIGKSNEGVLVVDNIARSHCLTRACRTTYNYSVTPFHTAEKLDDGTDLVLGFSEEWPAPFAGLIDEVRVWAAEKTLEELYQNMLARMPFENAEGSLVLYYNMRPDPITPVRWYQFPMNSNYWTQRYDLPSVTKALVDLSPGNVESPLKIYVEKPWNQTLAAPTTIQVPIPPMIPCVLGLEFPVGPCDGNCTTSVYGWSVSDSQFLKCKFGDVEVPGEEISHREAKCRTPPHFLPAFVPVSLANDGINFTDPFWVQKDVKHLYLGGGGRGCQALEGEDRITCGLRATSPGGRPRGRFCNEEAAYMPPPGDLPPLIVDHFPPPGDLPHVDPFK